MNNQKLAGPLGQAKRRSQYLRALRECRSPARFMFWWHQCFSTVNVFYFYFLVKKIFGEKIFSGEKINFGEKIFFLVKNNLLFFFLVKKNLVKIFFRSKICLVMRACMKHWSHQNINRAGERHSLRALKHWPRHLAWPEGPASNILNAINSSNRRNWMKELATLDP